MLTHAECARYSLERWSWRTGIPTLEPRCCWWEGLEGFWSSLKTFQAYSIHIPLPLYRWDVRKHHLCLNITLYKWRIKQRYRETDFTQWTESQGLGRKPKLLPSLSENSIRQTFSSFYFKGLFCIWWHSLYVSIYLYWQLYSFYVIIPFMNLSPICEFISLSPIVLHNYIPFL